MNRLPIVNAIFLGSNNRSVSSRAIIDTGASISAIPTLLAKQLGLKKIGMTVISTLGKNIEAPIYRCRIRIEDVVLVTDLVAADELEYPLFGMDIINEKTITQVFFPQIFYESINILELIPTLKQNTVLILGQDTTEIERLRAINKRLSHNKYTGIIVKEMSDIEIQSIEEKVNMLASLSRFIVCDNTVASGHIDELKICSMNRFVTAILQEQGKGATWMQADYHIDFPFMKTFYYPNVEKINDVVDAAIIWAENKIEERRNFFNGLYEWRKKQ